MKIPNIVDIKLANTKHPITSQKLSKTIKQAEKVSKVGSNRRSFLNEKYVKIIQSSYNVWILKFFNLEL